MFRCALLSLSQDRRDFATGEVSMRTPSRKSAGSADRRQFEALAVAAAQWGRGGGIVEDPFPLAVELYHRSGSTSDVREVTQQRALVIDLDVGVGLFAADDAVQKI